MQTCAFFKNTLSTTIATVLIGSALSANASSHREAPFITQNPQVDGTDFYMFRSYEPGREDFVTLIANFLPLQDSYGGPNYFKMNENALYEIHIDNTGDAQEDITFQFRFNNSLANDGAGLTVPALGQNVAVPLRNIGEVSSTDSDALNVSESYTLTMIQGDRRTGTTTAVTNTNNGNTIFPKPYDNVGSKTFNGQTYSDYADTFIFDANFSACPAGSQQGRVFVGQRKESFSVNLGEIFDLINTNPLGGVNDEVNIIDNKNITTLALEVPIDCLTSGNASDTIGGWMTASLPQVTVLDPTPTFEQPAVYGGAFTQVSRLGMPLVNEVVISLPAKDQFNASEPKDDAQFATFVTNPTLPVLIEALFPVAPAPSNPGRADLVAAFLTGLDGVNQVSATPTAAEMLRLNTGIAVTARASQNTLGVAAGDNAGFPNGRRPGDDVVDASLRVAQGLLCHLGLGLCDPADAPAGNAPITDGALQSAWQFDNSFPYLTTPIPGSPSDAAIPRTADAPAQPGQ